LYYNQKRLHLVLTWLATLHAAYTGWQGRLKLAARAIDERLKRCDPYQCKSKVIAKDA
jgi:hypothetical protein